MVRTGALILVLLLLATTWSGEASDKATLILLDLKSGAQPSGVSAGGAVVVGGLSSVGGFYWMPTTGVIYAGGLFATKVSRDGKVIVGQAIDNRLRVAAIWQRATEWRSLGSFPNALPCDAFLSVATDTSRDGTDRRRLREKRVHAGARIPVGRVDRHGRSGFQRCGPRHASPSACPRTGRLPSAIRNKRRDSSEGAKWVGTRQERFRGRRFRRGRERRER